MLTERESVTNVGLHRRFKMNVPFEMVQAEPSL
jgi:hypothetical protein